MADFEPNTDDPAPANLKLGSGKSDDSKY